MFVFFLHGHHLAYNFMYNLFGTREIRIVGIIKQRKSNAGYAFYRGFHGGTHGSAINNIDRMIGTMINTTEADIRFFMQDLIYRQLYTVYRGTISLPGFNITEQIHFFHSQGITNGDRMAHSTLRIIRCNYYYPAHIFYRFYQAANTFGGDIIVVGDEYSR